MNEGGDGMSIIITSLRTIRCRIARRLDSFFEMDLVGEKAGKIPNMLVRRAQLHVGKCSFCLAEKAQWMCFSERLQQMERPAAPPSVLEGVMERIARESKFEPTGESPARGRVPDWAFSDVSVASNLVAHWLVPIVSWMIVVATIPRFVDTLHRAIPEVFVMLSGVVEEAFTIARFLDPIDPSGLEVYLAALFWSGVGFGVAVVSAAFTKGLNDT